MADRYKVQTYAGLMRAEKERLRADIIKKVLKKAGIPQEKERMILTASLSELQASLFSEDKSLSLKEVVTVSIKRLVEACPQYQYGDANFKGSIDASIEISEDIQKAVDSFIELNRSKNDLFADRSSLFKEESKVEENLPA